MAEATTEQFVHLRNHTAYSLAEGAMHVKDLIKQCQGLGFPAVAITDTNNMFGALDFSNAGTSMGGSAHCRGAIIHS